MFEFLEPRLIATIGAGESSTNKLLSLFKKSLSTSQNLPNEIRANVAAFLLINLFKTDDF